jgi:hypothetical protein
MLLVLPPNAPLQLGACRRSGRSDQGSEDNRYYMRSCLTVQQHNNCISEEILIVIVSIFLVAAHRYAQEWPSQLNQLPHPRSKFNGLGLDSGHPTVQTLLSYPSRLDWSFQPSPMWSRSTCTCFGVGCSAPTWATGVAEHHRRSWWRAGEVLVLPPR